MSTALDRRGPYQILEKIGSGGMATVYRARHLETEAIVAIKEPLDAYWEAERVGAGIQKTLHERDPHVPRVEAIHHDDDPQGRWIAMEFVDGVDLSERLKQGPLAWAEAVGIARQLLAVLTSARLCQADEVRRGGIVHGDIKPSNVKVMASGEIRLLDFGIARTLLESGIGTTDPFRSVAYCSPERLRDKKIDVDSDLWSVGVVLYEMVAGRQPFRAATLAGVEQLIQCGRRPPPLDRLAPRALAEVIEMALDPRLERRYRTASEFADDLAKAIEGGVTLAGRRHGEATRETFRETTPVHNGNGVGQSATITDRLHGRAEATRPTGEPAPLDETTRPTGTPPADETTRPTSNGATAAAAAATARTPRSLADALASASEQRAAARARWLARLRGLAVTLVIVLLGNEAWALMSFRDLQSRLSGLARGDAETVWTRYEQLRSRSLVLRIGGSSVAGDLRDWFVARADNLISRFRLDGTSIRENGWRDARTMLMHAASIPPSQSEIHARLEYCNGQLARIGATDGAKNRAALLETSVGHFEEAARLRRNWPDPFLALAHVYAYGTKDPVKAEDALGRAQNSGLYVGEREAALLGDAYRLRAERVWVSPPMKAAEDRYRRLMRIRFDYVRAREWYERAPEFGLVPVHMVSVRSRLTQLDRRIEALIRTSFEVES